MVKIERYAAKGVWDPPTYSQAVKVTGAQTILYLAGQVAYDDKGGPAHRGDFKAQARAVFQAIKAQVEAGGGTMDNIVKINTYLTDIRNRADLGTIREEFLGKKTCASTLARVAEAIYFFSVGSEKSRRLPNGSATFITRAPHGSSSMPGS